MKQQKKRFLAQGPSDQAAGPTAGVRDPGRESNLAIQRRARQPNRTGLPDPLKSNLETASGLPMDDVKVHYNSSKPAQLQALAYTQGTQIHVGPGQEKHVPHEAWHVVQQKQGRVRANSSVAGQPLNDDPKLETEASRMGRSVAQRMPLPTEGAPSPPVVQLMVDKNLAPGTAVKIIKGPNKGATGTIGRRSESREAYYVFIPDKEKPQLFYFDELEKVRDRRSARYAPYPETNRPGDQTRDRRRADENRQETPGHGSRAARASVGSGPLPGFLVEHVREQRAKESSQPSPASTGSASTSTADTAPSFKVNPYALQNEFLLEDDDADDQQLLADRIGGATNSKFKGVSSTEIGTNNECVLAAFSTVQNNRTEWTASYQDVMTSTDPEIQKIAGALGLQALSLDQLLANLRGGGYRAFVRAESLDGKGLHAYCAHGVDGDRIIAWDPDRHEVFKNKSIPSHLIDRNMIFGR